MNITELRKYTLDLVLEHGPERARNIMEERAQTDEDFRNDCALHGYNIVKAEVESQTATKH